MVTRGTLIGSCKNMSFLSFSTSENSNKQYGINMNYKIVLDNRPYMLFWLGALISSFGDSFTTFGLAWYVLRRSNNPLDVGLTFLIFQLPSLFSGILAGWFLDRFRRETVMLVDNLARGMLVMCIPLLNSQGSLAFPLLYSIIALLGALSVITSVGSRAIITDLVSAKDYNIANSLDVTQRQISFIAGPSLAGVLVVLIGPLQLLWVDSGSFFLFALLLLFLVRRSLQSSYIKPESTKRVAGFLREMTQGMRFTVQNSLILALTSVSFCWNFGLGLFLVALPFYCERALKVGPVGMGILLSVNSIGVLLSALLFGPLRPRYPGRITCVLLIAQALCYGLLAFIPPFWLALCIYFLLGAFDDLGVIYLTSVRQRAVPSNLQGRVWAFTSTLGSSGEPLGSGAAGLLLVGLSAPAIVAVSGLPLFLIGLVWLTTGPIRRVIDEKVTD